MQIASPMSREEKGKRKKEARYDPRSDDDFDATRITIAMDLNDFRDNYLAIDAENASLAILICRICSQEGRKESWLFIRRSHFYHFMQRAADARRRGS